MPKRYDAPTLANAVLLMQDHQDDPPQEYAAIKAKRTRPGIVRLHVH